MITQYFFRNICDKPPPFMRKSNWIPPLSDNLTLVKLFTRTEQELTSINNLQQPNINENDRIGQPKK